MSNIDVLRNLCMKYQLYPLPRLFLYILAKLPVIDVVPMLNSYMVVIAITFVFKGGNRVLLSFGSQSWSERQHWGEDEKHEDSYLSSNTAELLCCNNRNEWYEYEAGMTAFGHADVKSLLEWITYFSTLEFEGRTMARNRDDIKFF